MTIPANWAEEGESSEFEANTAESEFPVAVPVRVTFDETKRLPPGFATFMTWPIGQVGVSLPTQILQRRMQRFKAKFVVSAPSPCIITVNSKQEPLTLQNPVGMNVSVQGVPGGSVSASGSVTNPGAFGGIAFTPSLPAGTYSVTTTVYLSGVVTAADGNNMSLVYGGTTINLLYPGVANAPVTTTNIVQVPAGGHTIGVQTINAASGAGAIYNAVVTVTPVAGNNQNIPDYDGMPPLYAIASIAGVTIGVMDESFGQVQ
jgi:hypothetical protein